jgi:hypothetical protein
MKKFCLTTMIALFFLIFNNGLQAQTTQPKLDQLKLNQKYWVGTWQQVISKDSVEIFEAQQYGNAFVGIVYIVVKGEKTFHFGSSTVYSPKEDNFKFFYFRANGRYSTLIGSWTAENKFSSNFVENFNPDKFLRKVEMIYDTPDSYTAIFYNSDGTKGREYKWTRVK